YAAGVTAYIEQAKERGTLPIEFRLLGYVPEPWQPTDSLLIARLMAYYLSHNWEEEISRYIAGERLGWDVLHEYLPDYPADTPAIVAWQPPRPSGQGQGAGMTPASNQAPASDQPPMAGQAPAQGQPENNPVPAPEQAPAATPDSGPAPSAPSAPFAPSEIGRASCRERVQARR